jgi:hypothetical protein
MRYQASGIRAKPVRPSLPSPPPSIAPNPFRFFSQMLSSLVPGIAQFVSGTPAQPLPSNLLTNSPNASISWTPSATASSSPSLADYFTFSTSERWTLTNKHARALSNFSPVHSPACPMAKVSSPFWSTYRVLSHFKKLLTYYLFPRLRDRLRRRPHRRRVL